MKSAIEIHTGFSAMQVCNESGLTYRQLDYYDRCGFFIADGKIAGSGHIREFSVTQLEQACFAAELMRAGMAPRAAFAAASALVSTGSAWFTSDRLVIHVGIASEVPA